MDMSDAIVPNSKQVNADDLIAAPRTVTITGVEKGTDEQKVFVHLAEYPGRTYRPSKSMARVMVAVWGKESSAYIGRRLTIYRNPEIMFGPNKVGGIEISHMSDIDGPQTVSITKTRGQKRNHSVKPLPAATKSAPVAAAAPNIPAPDLSAWLDKFNDAATMAELGAAWDDAIKSGVATHPQLVAAKDARKIALGAAK